MCSLSAVERRDSAIHASPFCVVLKQQVHFVHQMAIGERVTGATRGTVSLSRSAVAPEAPPWSSANTV